MKVIHGYFSALTLGALLFLVAGSCQSGKVKNEALFTEGKYQLQSPNSAASGELSIRRLPADKVAYSLLVVGPAPAYNQGLIEGESVVEGGKVILGTDEFGAPCRLELTVLDSARLALKTTAGDAATCGFGHGVVPDGIYLLANENQAGETQTIDQAQLQGIWRSTDDPTYELIIDAQQYKEYNRGQEVSTMAYKFFETCPAACGGPALNNCLKTWSEQDTLCYVVLQASLKNLELSLLGGNGQSIHFERLK